MTTWHETMSCFSVLQVTIQKVLHFACYIGLIGLVAWLKIVLCRIKFFLCDKEKKKKDILKFLFLKVQTFKVCINWRKSVGTGFILHGKEKSGRWCSWNFQY